MTLFAIPALGIIALERIIQTNEIKPLLIAGAVTGGSLILLALGAGLFRFDGAADANFPEWLIDALKQDRKSMLQASAWRSFGFVAAAFVLIFFALKQKISDLVLGLVLLALVTLDIWRVNRPYLNKDSFQENPSASYFAETPADKKIASDKTYFRVLDLSESLTASGRANYRFHSLGGYHGAKLRRYQDLLDNRISFELNDFVTKAQNGTFDFEGIQTINMLNTKYILAGAGEEMVFENPEANGAAWIPKEIIPAKSNQEEIELLEKLQTKTQATVNTAEFGATKAGSGQIKIGFLWSK
ncbi:hypothetical protein GHT06_005797 [Daphnia sinensis]|uniref:Uncharacterized protein n=1 Tax=Daphnia sinensis TaxID=1820382 RepID=A0AAD5KE66_9CRUS|nr:hypothetical protein GHT06_005797 [Daphnia sinensis]